MIVLVALAQLASLGASNYAADGPMAAPTTRPHFADEFSGPRIDTRAWRFDTHRNRIGWHNNERQYANIMPIRGPRTHESKRARW